MGFVFVFGLGAIPTRGRHLWDRFSSFGRGGPFSVSVSVSVSVSFSVSDWVSFSFSDWDYVCLPEVNNQ